MNSSVQTKFKQWPKTWILNWVILIGIAYVVYLSLPYIEYKGIFDQGSIIAFNIVKGIFKPTWSLLIDFSSKDAVPYLMLETVAIAFLGTIVGAILAIPLAFLSSRNMVPHWVTVLTTFFIALIRTMPAFVYGLMFIRVTGPGPFTGVLTLGVSSIGMIAKLYVEFIEDLDKGIIEALDATGCTTLQKIRYGVIPQLMGNFVSTTLYRFEINVKNATILGLIGAGGIGGPIMFALGGYRWNDLGALLIGLIVIVLIIEAISIRLRKKLAMGE